MKKTSSPLHPLLIEWSPQRVRLVDVAAVESTCGASIAECLGGLGHGREAIVAISQRSAFIRSLYVPSASRSEIAKVLELKLDQLLPLNPKEYVFGFRLGADVPGKGRLAVVGAMKTDSLRALLADASSCGLKVRAVVPLAFGSWLAARSRSQRDCVVIDSDGIVLNVDVIHEGELRYSRSIPLPDSREEIDDEIARTLSIAEASAMPVLSFGPVAQDGQLAGDKDPIEYLSDLHTIHREIFTLELPEKGEAERANLLRAKAQRALAAAVVAIAIGGYAAFDRVSAQAKSQPKTSISASSLRAARSKENAAKLRLAKAAKANSILDVAFKPGQTFSDMMAVLADAASSKSWFTGIVIGRGQPVSINGIAVTDADVAQFVAHISKDPRFEEMKVVSATKSTIGKRQVTQFVISGKPIGILAFDRAPKKDKRS